MVARLYLSLSPGCGGEASLTRRKGVAGGAGSDAVARYPLTGDFITNVSARRGEGDSELQFGEPSVKRIRRQQFFVRAGADQAAAVDDRDAIHAFHRRQAMRDDQRGA